MEPDVDNSQPGLTLIYFFVQPSVKVFLKNLVKTLSQMTKTVVVFICTPHRLFSVSVVIITEAFQNIARLFGTLYFG